MRLVSVTIKYVCKNFAYLLAACLFPSLLLGFFRGNNNIFTFFFDYHNTKVTGLSSITLKVMDFGIFRQLYPFVLFLGLGVVCASLLFSAIEHHLRVGKFSFKKPLSKINSSIISVFFAAILLYGWLMAWEFLLSCVLLLNHMIFARLGSTPNAVAIISSFLLIVISTLLLGESVLYSIFYIPTKLVLGYAFTDSLAFSIRLTGKRHWQLLLAVMLPIIFIFFLSAPIAFLPNMGEVASTIYKACLYMFTAMYYVSLCMTGWFELSGTERRDTKRIYYIK